MSNKNISISMPFTNQAQPSSTSTRCRYMTGYTISMRAADEFADRLEEIRTDLRLRPHVYLSEKYLDPGTVFRSTGIEMKTVGEGEKSRIMFVTQYGPYMEYYYSTVPQFPPCWKDTLVKHILDTQGITDYKFETVLMRGLMQRD